MALTIIREEPYPDDWDLDRGTPHPGGTAPVFAECHAYQVLRRELRRYTARLISGRSFLVSGHRGSGKTTLVLRAVEAALREDDPGRPRQRPLLVKLHGPSLLMKVARPSEPSAQKEPETKAGAGKEGKDPLADSRKTIQGLQPLDGDGSAQAALVQIAIALYRALTDEVVRCYRRFAYDRTWDGGAMDFPELVGQLIMELDNAPSPAVLRDFWSRIGALRRGVLWPPDEPEEDLSPPPWRPRISLLQRAARLEKGYGEDQGIREVVAISTAAQAFQVVTGCVEYKTVEKTCAKGDSNQTTQGKPVTKDILFPLLSLLTGGLVGGGTAWVEGADKMGLSVGLGLLTALVTSLTFSWTTTRTRNRSVEEDHTFVHDHSITTLDRELPIVITRIRRTGLAPVFIVDELDKVDDLFDRMKKLVEGLKHIVADNSFFCFLTDREYFEDVRGRSRQEAYPKEHTYFSHLLFLLYRPNDLHDYLNRLIVAEPSKEPEQGRKDKTGKLALSYLLLHRAMLHTFDLQRELAGICDGTGCVLVSDSELRSYLGYRYHIMIQLAIELLLNESKQKDQLNLYPEFGQFIYDALYMPSRNWLSGAAELNLDKGIIETYLRQRVGRMSKMSPVSEPKGESKPGSGPAPTTVSQTPNPGGDQVKAGTKTDGQPAPASNSAPTTTPATANTGGDQANSVTKTDGQPAPASGSAPGTARMTADAGGDQVKAGTKAQEETGDTESLPSINRLMGETDRQYLLDLVHGLVGLLADPKGLSDRLLHEGPPTLTAGDSDVQSDAEARRRNEEDVACWATLVNSIPGIELPLLQAVDGKPECYRWCRNPFGRALVEETREGAQQVVREDLLPQQQEDDDRFIGNMEKFLEALGGNEVSLSRLADMGILWSSPDWQQVQAARRRLREFRSGGRPKDKDLLSDQDLVHEYVGKLASRGQLLAVVLIAGRLLGHKAGRAEAREQTVRGVQALLKVVSFTPPLQETKTLTRINRLMSRYKCKALTNVPTLTRENLDEWIASVSEAHKQAAEGAPDDLLAAWKKAWHIWADCVAKSAKTGRSNTRPHLEQALCLAADGSVAATLVEPIRHLSLHRISTILWAALADTGTESSDSTPFCAGLPALYLLGMPPGIVEWFAHQWPMIRGSKEGAIPNEQVKCWLELTARAGAGRRRRAAFILSQGSSGVTSQWLPSPSFGALVAPQERLGQALYEAIWPALFSKVESWADSAVVFLEAENPDLEQLASLRHLIPPPLLRLSPFILSREAPKTLPEPWRVLHKTRSLDEAMEEASEIIGPEQVRSVQRS